MLAFQKFSLRIGIAGLVAGRFKLSEELTPWTQDLN